MSRASVSSIETFGLVDGPGIRTVIFFNGCKLRCKYCHNPETWAMKEFNYTHEEIAKVILKNKNYFIRSGGVTFSGGEPLLHSDFIIDVCKILKQENIYVAIDTAGVGNGNYSELLKYVDLVLLDIKHTNKDKYKELTGMEMNEVFNFIDALNKSGKDVWIRQVIVPGMMDNDKYLKSLVSEIKKINNVKKIEFLPFHRLGCEKYKALNINYPYEYLNEMDVNVCNKLYDRFMKFYND